jgi:hypothetical protein
MLVELSVVEQRYQVLAVTSTSTPREGLSTPPPWAADRFRAG